MKNIIENYSNHVSSIKSDIRSIYAPLPNLYPDLYQELDFLLLLIEALDLNAIDKILLICKELHIDDIFSNKVELWEERINNPLRKSTRRSVSTKLRFESMLIIISILSSTLYPEIRSFLSSKESVNIYENNWKILEGRFISMINERMNPRRSKIKFVKDSQNTRNFINKLLIVLGLSCGPYGIDRLMLYLFNQASIDL